MLPEIIEKQKAGVTAANCLVTVTERSINHIADQPKIQMQNLRLANCR